MDFNLSKEQQLIQQVAKEFSEEVLAPIADEIEESHNIPMEVFRQAGELGLMALPISEEWGGADAGYDGYALAMEQFGKVSGSFAMAVMAHVLGMSIIETFCNDEQKKAALPKAATGEYITSFAFTEPNTGSDPKQITGTARREGDHWVLNGTKRFITNAAYPGLMCVVMREEESGKLTTFLVDKKIEEGSGYTVSKPWSKVALNGGQLLDLYFKDYKLPLSAQVGEIGEGFTHLTSGIGYGKMGISAYALGLADAAYEEGLNYVMGKMHRGTPIVVKFQSLQMMLAEMHEKMEAARLILYRAACNANFNSKHNQLAFARDMAECKDFVTNAAREVVNISLDMHACYGLMTDYKIERMYREACMMPQIESPAHVQKVILANHIIADYK